MPPSTPAIWNLATPRVSRASSWVCESCQRRSRISRISCFPSVARSFTASKVRDNKGSRKARLPDTPARTRFAPSPTGHLHLGSIRTALFNFLLAQRTKGQFLLRIEDTDQKRTVPGAEEALFRDLRWAGLEWNEGPLVGGPFGPYRQSERLHIYSDLARTLLDNSHAYRCFCSSERLHQFNEARHREGLQLGYDRKCAHIPAPIADQKVHDGHAHTIRFRAPEQYPSYNDLVYGKSGHGEARTRNKFLSDQPVFEDPVLMKTDGFPTYHFANIVDDHLMQITHVIRGSEWMSSTPLHIALYDAMGWKPPQYGHVPLLVNADGQKLSKRHADTEIASFRERGILPEALTNFAALLGWSHQQKSDIFDLKELRDIFDLKITRGNTIVAFQKLGFLQQHHARRRIQNGGEELEQMIRDVAQVLLDKHGAGIVKQFCSGRQLRDVLAACLRTESLPYFGPQQFADSLSVFLVDDKIVSAPALRDVTTDTSLLPCLRVAAQTLLLTPSQHWLRAVHKANLAMIEISAVTPVRGHPVDVATMSSLPDQKSTKKALYSFLRFALLHGQQGPSIPDTMEILGRDVCVSRLQEAILKAREFENETSAPKILSRRVPLGEGNSHWASYGLPKPRTEEELVDAIKITNTANTN